MQNSLKKLKSPGAEFLLPFCGSEVFFETVELDYVDCYYLWGIYVESTTLDKSQWGKYSCNARVVWRRLLPEQFPYCCTCCNCVPEWSINNFKWFGLSKSVCNVGSCLLVEDQKANRLYYYYHLWRKLDASLHLRVEAGKHQVEKTGEAVNLKANTCCVSVEYYF